MEVFFYKYRKIVIAAIVLLFLCFFFEIYRGIENIDAAKTGERIGTLLGACVYLLLAFYFIVSVRKANKAFKEKNADTEANSIDRPGS